MFGHNPFSWVPLRAESIISFKSEGDGEEWRSIPDSTDSAPAGYDDDTHEDNGWTAYPCEAAFFLWKGTGDQIGIAYPANSSNNTGEWWKTGATSMTVNGYWAGEPYIDAYTRVMRIVGNWSGGDEGFVANYAGETSVEAIPTITTIAQPASGKANWTWISGISDIPTNCAVSQNCSYSNWSEWSPCDKDREPDHPGGVDGTQTRTRTVTSGSNCDGYLTETQDCLSPQPCEWGAWSEWVYDNSSNKMHGQQYLSGCGVWDGDTESFPSSLTRTRTRQIVKSSQGYEDIIGNEGCPDRDSYVQENGRTSYTNTQTETETVSCPTSENSNCPDGQEVGWRWGAGNLEKGYYCKTCFKPTDSSNATTDSHGCKTGCKTGYEDIDLSWLGLGTVCHIVGCTDPTAKNYDDTATLACNSSSMWTKWKVGAAGLDGKGNANKCCEYDCDNPLLKTDWNGQCKDECIDGYALNSAGECEEQCNEGFELIDGKCQKSPDPDDKKTIITTQTDISAVIEPESSNMTPIIGGIAVLGVVGYFLMQRK